MIATFDIETYYDPAYSLRRMPTVEYVLDQRYQSILAAIQVDSGPCEIFVGHDAIARKLNTLDWDKTALLAHNTKFDGAVLAWRFGHVPALYLDTLSMARATTHWVIGRSSLEKVSDYLGLPPKGHEVTKAIGKRLEHFTPRELDDYGEYCRRDALNCRAIFDRLRPHFPHSELRLIDLIIRMFVEPQVRLNANVLAEHLHQVKAEKAAIMGRVAHIDKSVFSSQQKFKALLEDHGVDVPTKISPATGEEIPALAKNDRAFKELCMDEGQSLEVQALLAARMNAKSTIEETRTQKLLDHSLRYWGADVDQETVRAAANHGIATNSGWAAVPLKYYGARPGRLSGDGGENWQNFKRGSRIREAIEAPPGYRVVHRDASQIEARMVAWLAGCDKLTTAFAGGRDVYSEFATSVYQRPVTKADAKGRFVGKTCLASGTRVLTPRGAIPIENITITDLVWDGVEWVRHDGLIVQGLKETLMLSGVSLTPDHLVWCGTEMRPAGSLVSIESTLFPNWVLESASWPSQDMSLIDGAASSHWSLSATAERLNTPLIRTIFVCSEARDVSRVPVKPRGISGIGSMLRQCLTTCTEPGYLTGWPRQLRGAIAQLQSTISITACAALRLLRCGARTARSSFVTCKLCPAGTNLNSRWIESTLTVDTNRVTSDLPLAPSTSPTNAVSKTLRLGSESLKPVYDLANAGPRRRFTILSDDGPVIVSNCILGLGYGCGPDKFRHMLFIGNGGMSMSVDEHEARRIVYHYRSEYPEIPLLWVACGVLLDKIIGKSRRTGRHAPVNLSDIADRIPVEPGYDALWLPNGMCIAYPNLRWERGVQHPEMVYDDLYGGRSKIYGAKACENISQALARIVVTDIAVRLFNLTGRHPFLSTHDSLDYCVPEQEVEWWDKTLEDQFAIRPSWAPDLPLASEGGWGRTLLAAEKMENQ